ncbi:hypothetical protein [Lysinibacillus xylanilyticus]|uniref:hypothetical protein n=1 Tax=Lysinibacillus xylanilyticus TaxID=582475 RepID=UPI000A5279C7|nr:hypothetical protein [Lysinibacillus xylanilyticus]
MRKQGKGGSIINTASTLGLVCEPIAISDSAAKQPLSLGQQFQLTVAILQNKSMRQ